MSSGALRSSLAVLLFATALRCQPEPAQVPVPASSTVTPTESNPAAAAVSSASARPSASASSAQPTSVASTSPTAPNTAAVEVTPPVSELVEHATGKLLFDDGSPASGLPIEIETQCEPLLGFTDSEGTFRVDTLRLPARLRSGDRLLLVESKPDASPAPSVALVRSAPNNQGELAPLTVSNLPVVALIVPGSHAAALARLLPSLDVLAQGPLPGSALVLAAPRKLQAARAEKLEVIVLDADANRYTAESSAASEAAWKATLTQRIAAARAAFRAAQRGHVESKPKRFRELGSCPRWRPTP